MGEREVDVLVIGGGPAGLACAVELRRLGVERVLVVEREERAGGVPRHTNHTGYGLRDLRRVMSGPRYAARYVGAATSAGVELRTETAAVDWNGSQVVLTSPAGTAEVAAGATVLATGCRERPRTARGVAGSRPLGVFTTGRLQQAVELYDQPIGNRAVVVGAEHVSFSAVHTLGRAGVEVAAMVTPFPRHQTYPPFKWLAASRLHVPILTDAVVSRLIGHPRLTGVEVTDRDSNEARTLDCDTVVFTGDWVPEHEFARLGGIVIDPGTNGPRIDESQRTSVPGVFAAGNLLHGAETADRAAICGRFTARAVHGHLAGSTRAHAGQLSIEPHAPVTWVTPNAVSIPDRGAASDLPHGRFILRVDRPIRDALLVASQDGVCLWRSRRRSFTPNRPVHLPAVWLGDARRDGGPIYITVRTDAA